jgi:HlyD family secretion protein
MARRFLNRRNILIGLAVGLVAAVVWMLAPRSVPADVAPVVRGSIDEVVYDQGQARVNDAYGVAAPAAGRLLRIALKIGDRVTAGQVVARIVPAAPILLDPSVRAQREAAVAAARADLDRAIAERARAEALYGRMAPLAAQGAVSRQSADDARAAAAQAAAAVQVAAAALASARAALIGPGATGGPTIAVTAPSAGYVTRVEEPSERTIAAGTPLIQVSDNRDLEAVIEFLSQDAARMAPGMAAEVYDWGGPRTLGATVRRVEPQGFTKVSALGVEEQRVFVWLRITDPTDRWSTLAPGYRVWGRVFLRREAHALKVPVGALQRRGGQWAVFRIEAGRARLRPVAIGAISDREAEILSGLAEGDRVVVFPSDAVSDSVRIAPRRQD